MAEVVALGLLTTKAPHLGLAVAVRLGLAMVRLGLVGVRLRLGLVVAALRLGLVVVAPCLGLVAAVASSPFRVRRKLVAAPLGLAVYRRRRGATRVGS